MEHKVNQGAAIGFTRPSDGQQFVLIGSHFSTRPVDGQPFAKRNCSGCAKP